MDFDRQQLRLLVNGSVTTLFIGDHTVLIPNVKSVEYYTFAGQRVAIRVQSDANATGVLWLHGDHLGSASVATDASGNKIANSDSRYLPLGEPRPGFAGSGLPTDRRFAGQISVAGGLIDMNARNPSESTWARNESWRQVHQSW